MREIKRFKPKKKWLFPFSMEREYQRLMRDLVSQMNEISSSDESALLSVVESSSSRSGGADERIRNIIGLITERIENRLSENIVTQKIKQIGFQTSSFNANQFREVINSVFAINLTVYEPWLNDMLDVWTGENTRLIKTVKSEYLGEVERIVRQGWLEGIPGRQVSKEIQKRFELSNGRAQRIARDQIGKLNGQISERRQTDAGIEEYEWLTSRDARVRDEHSAREGKIFRWDNPPKDGHPGREINCRCVAQPILDLDKIRIYGAMPRKSSIININNEGR